MISVVVVSKDEPSLALTLEDLAQQDMRRSDYEIVVVDASDGRLDHIRARHPGVRWIPFSRQGVRVSIPHQRNVGVRAARGDVIAFTDSGCRVPPTWLARLTAPLGAGEDVVAGPALTRDGRGIYDAGLARRSAAYLDECPTINLAFRRAAFDGVGGFDEGFAYGSDVDFSWRLQRHGFRIRSAPEAVVHPDWGGYRRQLRRAHRYGVARVRLYRKHSHGLARALRRDPVMAVYPLFLLGLPLTLRWPLYPAVLAIPAWRNRRNRPLLVVADHLAYGAGVLTEILRGRRGSPRRANVSS